MIGRRVPNNEFKEVLARQAARDDFLKELEGELRAIKPGECLVYESRPESPMWISIGLAILVDKVKGLKVIKEATYTYVYREE